ncbi:MAG: aspartate aminotransferase family protein [Alphaproteobacteria bacterium]
MTEQHGEAAPGVIPGDCLGTFKLPDEVAFVAARGAGASLWATDGREFIDFVLGSGPMVIGHAHPRVVAAIQEQAARGTTFYTMNDVAPRLAERIAGLVPCAEAVKFVGDGAEATFYALRLARAFTGRTLVLKFEGAYHGHHDYALHGVKPTPGTNYPAAKPDSAGIPAEVSNTMLIAPFNDLEATSQIVEPYADRLAAIIVEPVQRSLMPKPGFLDGLRKLCDRVGALLVFDEVVTGFRLALGGAQEAFGVTPDLCALGKVVGGGLPMAAVAGRRDVLELTVPGRRADGRSVYLSGTLNGNPIAAAAGLATIDVLEEENGPAKLAEVGGKLARGLEDCAHKLSISFQMVGPPAFGDPVFGDAAVSDYRSYESTNRAAAKQFGIELLRRGIFAHPASKLYVSTVHSDAQIERTCKAALEAMRAVRDKGQLR